MVVRLSRKTRLIFTNPVIIASFSFNQLPDQLRNATNQVW